jgi:hypothetical protein
MNCTPATLGFVEFLVYEASHDQLEKALYNISRDQLLCIREMLHNLGPCRRWIKDYVNQARRQRTKPPPRSITRCQIFMNQFLKQRICRHRVRDHCKVIKYGLASALKSSRRTLMIRDFSTRTSKTHQRSTSNSDTEPSQTTDKLDASNNSTIERQGKSGETWLLKPQSKQKKKKKTNKKRQPQKKKVTSISFNNNQLEGDDSDIADTLKK